VEPINRGGVDQTWEHTRSETESITNGREAESHVQVSADLVDEEVEDWALSVLNTVRSSLRSNFTDDTVNFILSEQFWNVAGRNDIVDINEEVILYNL